MKNPRSFLFKSVVILAVLMVSGLTYQPLAGRANSTLPPAPIQPSAFSLHPLPNIPTIVDQLYLGVPAGNGHQPQRVALDSQNQRLYTFNSGLSTLEGNTISLVDLKTNAVTGLIPLNNTPRPNSSQDTFSPPPNPLDIQVDPYRPRLYALWGDLYASPPYANLTIINRDDLTILKTLSGVMAVVPGPDRLYLANETRLWTVDPNSLSELTTTNLQPALQTSNLQRLLLNPDAKRLYLGRSSVLEVYDAATLALVNTYQAPSQLMQVAVDQANKRILVIDHDGTEVSLRALDGDGRPFFDPAPFILTDDTYSDPHLVLTGSTAAITNRSFDAYSLQRFNPTDLTLLDSQAIPSYPTDVAGDAATGRFYLTYTNPGSYVFAVDPAGGAAKTIYTALTLSGALADPAANRLYVLNSAATLQVLDLADAGEIARLETRPNLPPAALTFNFQSSTLLALDPGRWRLYLSGDPAQIIDTQTLSLAATLDTPGQLTPDPGSDRLYLTPPCQCRTEQCNTLILNAGALTGTTTLFPAQDPFVAPCVVATQLDGSNHLLYAHINNGVPGSNGGNYFSVFDVAGPPQLLYTDGQISYGLPALDPIRARAFMSRYRLDRSFLHRFEWQAQSRTFTQTLELADAAGQLIYDPTSDHLYAVNDTALQVFDGDLTLLSEISLPGQFSPLTFDPQAQRLYLTDANGNLLIIAAGGGQLEAPSAPPSAAGYQPTTQPLQLFVAPTGDYFQINRQRLYRSIKGQSWELLGRGLPARPVSALAISPNYQADQTLLVGLSGAASGRNGGLFRSGDGGATWQPSTRGLTDLEIGQVAFSPTFGQDRTIFLTTPYRGLFRSSDGGESWVSLADTYATDPSSAQLKSLAVSPTFADDKLVLIAANSLLRSTDGGNSWIDTGLPPGQVAFSPNFSQSKLILSDGRWRSVDGGQSWQPAAAGLEPNQGTQRLFFAPNFAAAQTVYLALYQQYDQPLKLQRSVDAGRTWQSLLGGLPANFQLAAATVLPNGDLYLSGREGRPVTLSPQSLTWGRPAINLAQLDLQDMVVSPSGEIFVANSVAGVFRSADGGRSWTDTNFPARADETKVARLALAPTGSLFAATGTIVERSEDGGQNWTYLSNLPTGFEVTTLAVSPNFAGDGVVLAGGNYAHNQLLRSADGGKSWRSVFEGDKVEGAADVAAIAFSPNFAADGLVFAWLQYGGLVRSGDGGQNWAVVPGDKSGAFAQTLAVSPDGRLYLGALYGGLYVSEDNGQSWQDLTGNIPGERTWSSALAFGLGDTLLLGSDIGVYHSPDGSQSWNPASAGLPLDPDRNLPQGVRALAFSGPRLYAALVKGGLYVSEDLGQSWHGAGN